MDRGSPTPSDPANGTRSPLLREDWFYVEAIPFDDFRESDFALLDAQAPVFYAERQAEQVLRIMRGMADDPSYGFRINTLRHCLQSATLAHRAGKDEDYVAVAFLHDIGFDIALLTHGAFAAALVGPYVSSEIEWMLANHGDFQAFHFRRHPGIDRLAREKWRGHPAFAMTAEFCAEFDQCAMDPDYDTMPIEAFEPMVRRLFARPPRASEPVSQAFPASI